MTSPLGDLYQEVILDHNRRPRNFRVITGARCQEGYNPLCGDRVKVYVTVANGVLTDVAFEGIGCAISQASASLMTEALRGKPLAEALRLCEGFQDMVTAPHDEPAADLGKLSALAGVREYPSRVKCASLAWHALKAAIVAEADGVVSTE
jgi:nitrogen fixation NifU-like protein